MAAPRSFVDVFGQTIELTTERRLHVLTQHQELEAIDHLLAETLQAPDIVIRSVYEPAVASDHR